jgi:PAS domain S-box-containing protein
MRRHSTHPSPHKTHPTHDLEQALQQHQVELEHQNDELRRTQSDLAAARDRYLDLYDFAPVGYLTLDTDGRILEVNRTGATLLGMAPQALKGNGLGRFVMAGDSDRWQQYLQHVLAIDGLQRVDLGLAAEDGHQWYGQIDSLRTPLADGMHALRVTLTDITERLRADMERRIAALDNDAREAERRRVALELHENLGQTLSVLKLDVAHMASMSDSATCRECAKTTLAALDEAVSTVRRITADLHPPMLDDLGLNAALEWLANDTARRVGLQLSLALGPEAPPLAPATALAVYRFVQAALSHLLQHTDSTDVHLEMQRQPDTLKLVMQARGTVGPLTPHTDTQPQDGQILQHRARLMGGRLMIDAARDRSGWLSLYLSLPMAQNEQGLCQHMEALA